MSRMLRALQQIEAKSPPRDDTRDDLDVTAKTVPDSPEPSSEGVAAKEKADVSPPEPVRDSAAIEATLAHAELVVESAAGTPTVETVFAEIPESDATRAEASNVTLGEVPIPREPTVPQTPSRPADPQHELWSVPSTLGSPDGVDDPYEEMARNILEQINLDRQTALMFTSPGDGEMKIGLVISLAAAIVRQTTGEVLVVDANLGVPSLGAYLGINASCGLAHVLMGTAEWKPIVRKSTLERLSLLPGCPFPAHGPPTNGSNGQWSQMKSLLKELKEAYPLVLVDGASLAHDEVGPMAACCDGTYLAVHLRRTTRRSARAAVRIIGDCGGQVLGSIVVRD